VEVVIGSYPGRFDAVLMDIQIPVLDGIEATRQSQPKEATLGSRLSTRWCSYLARLIQRQNAGSAGELRAYLGVSIFLPRRIG